jgi:hypothetical protein
VSIETRFDRKTGVFWLVLEGEIDFRDVMQILTDLYASKSYPRRIWDLRKLTSRPSREEIAALVAALRRLRHDGRIRSALLTSSDLHYGVGRALQPQVDEAVLSLGVFRTEDDAVAWVTVPGGARQAEG